jgi:hypothetical protein
MMIEQISAMTAGSKNTRKLKFGSASFHRLQIQI